MHKIQTSLIALSLCALIPACTTIPVEMLMPTNFTSANIETVKGLEYQRGTGKFKIGNSETQYSRRGQTVTWLETLKTEKVGADFKYSHAGTPVIARCESYERKIVNGNSGYSKIALKPFTYGCTLKGTDIPANAAVNLAVKDGSKFKAGAFHLIDSLERVGEAQWGSANLTLKSIHENAGVKSPIPAEITPPEGYYFYNSGSVVAVLDMVDGIKLHTAPNLQDDMRGAINASVRAVLLHIDVENYY